MATYAYKILDSSGTAKKGAIEAKTETQASEKLRREGYTIIEIKEQGFADKDINISIGKMVKPHELAMFCNQFVSILEAGVTVVTALDMLSEQTDNKNFAKALKAVQISVEKGDSLGNAMKQHPKIFPPMLVNMTIAGEASGSLEVAFRRMADHFEKDHKLKSMLSKAMIYPAMVLAVAFVVVIVILVLVVPTFSEMFNEMDMDLPKATTMLVNMSEFVKAKWWLIAVVIGAIVGAFKLFKSTATGAKICAQIGLRAPLFGDLTVKSSAARFSRTLSTLLAAGIPLIDAIENVANVMSNNIVKDGLLDAKSQVARGVPLSKPLKDMGIFPPLLVHMTRIGEETGSLEQMLDKISVFYDEEVQNQTEKLTAALEPLIIVLLAGIVGFVVLAVMSPMLKMYDGIDQMAA